MSENTKKFLMQMLSVFLTALVSAVIASLQEYLRHQTGVGLPGANPENAAAIGTIVRIGYVSLKAS